MTITIQQKETQLVKQQSMPDSIEQSLSPLAYSGHPGLALQRIQSGTNSTLQMKQDIMILQQTIGNRAVVQLLAQMQKQASDTSTIHNIAAAGVQGSGSKLPHYDKIQASFGTHDVSHIQVYSESQAAAASRAIGAQAYATGTKVAFAESNPSLHTAAHEAAHIIQQQSGVQLKGGIGEAGDSYEQHADQVADAVVQGKSAQAKLDAFVTPAGSSHAIQRLTQREEMTAEKPAVEPPIPKRIENAVNSPVDMQTESIEAILSMPPAKAKRTREEKEQDLAAAETIVERLVNNQQTTAQVASYFPALAKRFGLTRIEFEDIGEPGCRIAIEINPRTWISASDKLTWAGDLVFASGHSKLENKAKFTTAYYLDDTVGKTMETTIGPNHPQGSGPKGIRDAMSSLPTEPTLDSDKRYIRGHLLNDNLGGPGDSQNLFPITDAANKRHHDDVEFYVKQWVNEKGYWVDYKVTVDVKEVEYKSANAGQKDGTNYINADLKCEAYALNASGDKKTPSLTKVIHSEYKANPSSDITIDDPTLIATNVDPNFAANSSKVELSARKKLKADYLHLDQSIQDKIDELSKLIKNIIKNKKWAGLEYLYSREISILYSTAISNGALSTLEQTAFLREYVRHGNPEYVSPNISHWNRMVNYLNNIPDKVEKTLDTAVENLKNDHKYKSYMY